MIPVLFTLLLAQEKAIVEGAVVNSLTNEPLRKAHIALDDGKNRYATASSAEGTFRFEGIEPGKYRPEAQRDGFLDAGYLPWLEAAAGQRVKDVVIKLMPEGVIAGHVIDEDGDPVPGASVNYERTIQVNGRKVSLDSESGTEANGEGYFFFNGLKGGRYRLSASPPYRGQPPERSGESTPREELIFTDDPLPVQLAPGAAIRNVEIRMKRSVVFRVRGRVLNFPKERPGLTLNGDSESKWNHPARMTGDAFEFLEVPPGNYVLSVHSITGNFPEGFKFNKLFCHVPVTVSDRNIDDIVVELTPGPSIAGTIKLAGGKFEKPPEIHLLGGMIRPPLTAEEDGTFSWENLAPIHYWLAYAPPEGDYIKSILLNHQPIEKMAIDLSAGASVTLEIMVAPNAATVSGVIHDTNGNPSSKGMAVLWNDSDLYFRQTDASGAVKFANLAPGEYRIAAWESAENEYLSIPEFRARFDAQKVTLKEGSHENVDVKLISKSASDAEVAKLQ